MPGPSLDPNYTVSLLSNRMRSKNSAICLAHCSPSQWHYWECLFQSKTGSPVGERGGRVIESLTPDL